MNLEIALFTRNRSNRIMYALQGLLAQNLRDITLRIYDNGEREGCCENEMFREVVDLLVYGFHYNVIVSRVEEHNITKLRQIALDACASEYILYMDDDVFPMPGTVSICLTCSEERKKAAFVTPSFIDYKDIKGHVDFSLDISDEFPSEVPVDYRIYRRYSTSACVETEFADTGFVMFNTSLLRSIGGFKGLNWDEMSMGDDTFITRVLGKKFRGYFISGGVVFHFPKKTYLNDPFVRNCIHRSIRLGKFDHLVDEE